MSKDPIAAIGARIERHLNAMGTKHKAIDAAKAQRAMSAAVPFALPDDTAQVFGDSTSGARINRAPNPKATGSDEIGVGATFRRKGVLSDVPMTVTRTGDGVVVAAFTDSAGSHEIAFDASQVDVITKAPVVEAAPVVQFFPSLIDLVKQATPVAAAVPVIDAAAPAAASGSTAVPAAAVAPTQPAASTITLPAGSVVTAVPAAATVPAAPAAASEAPLPAGAIRLPDGTLQFGYAPTGGPIDRLPVVQPPVPAEFGVGATFRRKGVIGDVPMTVSRVGDGVLMANVTFATSDGRREMAFIPDQLDLVTRAPITG